MNRQLILWMLASSCLLCLAANDKALKVKKPSEPLIYGQRHALYSNTLEETRLVDVYLPETYHQASSHHVYPVLVVLEGDFFHTVTGLVKHLSSHGSMPETIVVGFPKGSGRVYGPNVYTNESCFWPPNMKQFMFNASPDTFIQFFETELFPFLGDTYRTANFRMLLSSSSRTAFSFHAFTKAPDLFQAHIAFAAGDILSMGYQPGSSFIDAFVEDLKKAPHKTPWLYVSSSSSDVASCDQIGKNLKELESRSAPHQSQAQKVKTETIDDPGHYDILPTAFMSAMELIFPKDMWHVNFNQLLKKQGGALANIDAFHQNLSEHYGFKVLPKARRWNNSNSLEAAGGRLIREKRWTEAEAVVQRLISYRPQYALAREDLSKALEGQGKRKEAIAAQQEAVNLGELSGDRYTAEYRERLQQLKASEGK